jgi:hypothetical protein
MFKYLVLFAVILIALPCQAKVYSISDFKTSLKAISLQKENSHSNSNYYKLLEDALSDHRNYHNTKKFTILTLKFTDWKATPTQRVKIHTEVIKSILKGLSKRPGFSIMDSTFLDSTCYVFSKLDSNFKYSSRGFRVFKSVYQFSYSHGASESDWNYFLDTVKARVWIPWGPMPGPPPVS